MGGRGSAATRNSTESRDFKGKSVADLLKAIEREYDSENYTDYENRIRKTFNIPNATGKQIDSLRQIIRGMEQYDRGYDENKTPYNIYLFTVEEMGGYTEDEKARRKELGMRSTAPSIYVSISTEPNVASAYLRMTDAKDHMAMIGPNGGLYDFSDKTHKKRKLNMFDVQYGKRNL